MRNEFYVAERILRAAAALDWPADRLEIQVLDDSDDETRARVAAVAEDLRSKGVPIEVLAREHPTGYKAGALQAGLLLAKGSLVAIFDADCDPPPSFLREVAPHFADPKVGLVQVRWTFWNRTRSLFTRLQATLLDGVFAVDQPARSLAGAPFQFNGTNGVWRRQALEDAGGWRGEMLAEDVDMAFRAFLAGYRLVHLSEQTVPTEIPETMTAFRAQQKRWARGSAQVLRAMTGSILRARVPTGAKVMMILHLGRHAIDPFLLSACLSTPATTLWGMPFLLDYGPLGNAAIVGLVFLSVFVHYGVALRATGRLRAGFLLVPLVIPLAIGLSLLYTVAFVGGLFEGGGEFVRTPKEGGAREAEVGPVYRSPFDPLALVETALGAAHAYFAVVAFGRGYWPYAGFFTLVSGSFLWVGIASLVGLVRAVRAGASLRRSERSPST
jgi:cellulose synthase/poly-beta-1,6-N-acetylglucosamine synthase-like glycosyltransferase